jgi:hypothetical protein
MKNSTIILGLVILVSLVAIAQYTAAIVLIVIIASALAVGLRDEQSITK